MLQQGSQLAISFSGSGLLLVYHLGVLVRLRACSVPVKIFAGSSGGAIAATVAAVIPQKIDKFLECYALQGLSMRGLEEMLPEDAHIKATGTTAISLTECGTGQNVLTTTFESRNALLEAVEASCHIPASSHPLDLLLSSGPHCFPDDQGRQISGIHGTFCDGGFSAFVPELPGYKLLRVSVMAGPTGTSDEKMLLCRSASGICFPGSIRVNGTQMYLSSSNLMAGIASVAGRQTVLRSYYDWGNRDCAQFLKENPLAHVS